MVAAQRTFSAKASSAAGQSSKNKVQIDGFQTTTPDFEVSCCYGLLALSEMTSTAPKTIPLHGGSPIREMAIVKEEVQARRTGWRSVVKAITGTIQTKLKLDVIRAFPQSETIDMIAMPDVVIYPKVTLPLLKSYREFLTIRSLRNDLTINTSLHNIIEVKTFCRCFDCPDILFTLAAFWKD